LAIHPIAHHCISWVTSYLLLYLLKEMKISIFSFKYYKWNLINIINSVANKIIILGV
jgi:hypothetical protein